MANTQELFNILGTQETNPEGIFLKHQKEGDAATAGTDVLLPATVAKDESGNYILLPVSQAGAAQGKAVPVLGFRDSSGNLIAPQLTASGQIAVSSDVPGTVLQALGQSATGVLNTAVDVATITLATSEDYVATDAIGAATRTTLWQLVQVNDATETVITEFITGAGQYTFGIDFPAEFSSGASGTQELILRGTQLFGKVTDLRGSLKVLQKA